MSESSRARLGTSDNRKAAEQAFLDAAERLLIRHGFAGISTRKIAEEAGANHGLVHYYFGSMEELLMQVAERFTTRIIERQRAMYSAQGPFLQKWRKAMNYIDEDLASGYPKVWCELEAMAWNRPEFRPRIAHLHEAWRTTLSDALSLAMDEYKLDRRRFPLDGMTALVKSFNMGILFERLNGVNAGHDSLIRMIDRWLQSLESAKKH